jgi:hypothetical protein
MSAETNPNPVLKVVFSITGAAHLSRKLTGWHQIPETVMATQAQNSAQFMNIVQFGSNFCPLSKDFRLAWQLDFKCLFTKTFPQRLSIHSTFKMTHASSLVFDEHTITVKKKTTSGLALKPRA